MKKSLLPILTTILFSEILIAQNYSDRVGINTNTPQTTLDVTAPNDNKHIAGIQAPRLTRAELTAKGNSLYGEKQKGTLIYITDVSGGNATGQRVVVTEPGYYYFDGNLWQRAISTAEYTNLYIKDGTLTGNRTMNQENKTLTFTGTATGGTVFKNTSGTAATQKAALQIIDGGQMEGKVLTSDENGNATWKSASASVRIGTFSEEGVTNINKRGVSFKTGATITLDPGVWAVSLGFQITPMPNASVKKGGYWNVIFLSQRTEDEFGGERDKPDVHQGKFTGKGIRVNTSYLAAGYIDFTAGPQTLFGSQIITINENTPQTFNVYFFPSRARGGLGDIPNSGYYTDAFKANGDNTFLYAIKLGE